MKGSDLRLLRGSDLVGRDSELALLLTHYKRVEVGIGSTVLIEGDGGIGKSRLATEAVKRTAAMGASTVVGHATRFDRGVPYALFREIVASLSDHLSGPLEQQAVELNSLLRTGADATETVADGSSPHDVLGAATGLIRLVAEQDPLVMLWEDLHEADADSLSLFTRLARRLTGSRVLLIGSFRSSTNPEMHKLARFVDQFELDGSGAFIELGPLDRSETRAMIANLIAVEPDKAIVDLIFSSSRGNPFFTTETMRSLITSSSVVGDGTRGHLVRQDRLLQHRTALVHRFFEIGSEEAQVARILSAFGRISLRHLSLVASIAGLTESRVAASFDLLVAGHLLVRLDTVRFEFAHAILREALYDDLGPAEQRRMHRLITERLRGEAIDGVEDDVIELATHLGECADPHDERVAEVLAEAGRITSRTAPLVGARWFSKAAACLPASSPERTELVALEAASMFRASRPHRAAELGLEALRNMAPGPLRTRTLADTVNSLYICADLQTAVDVIDEEERRCGPLKETLLSQRAHFLAQLGRDEVDETDFARGVPSAGTAELAIMMSHDLHRASLRGDGPVAARLTDSLRNLLPAASIRTKLAILGTLALGGLEPGNTYRVAEILDSAASLRSGNSGVSIGGQLEATAVELAFRQGRWDDAIGLVPDLIWDFDQFEARICEGMVQRVVCEIHLQRGDVCRAADIAGQFNWHVEAIRRRTDACVGRVALAAGDVRGARRHLEQAKSRIDASGMCGGLDDVLEALIEVCVVDGDLAEAVEHLAALDFVAARNGFAASRLRADLVRAKLLNDVGAARAAHDSAGELGLKFMQAQAALIAASLGDNASENLTSAHATFVELGAVPWRERSLAQIRAFGLPAPRSPGISRNLTETERALAQRVGDGMTNNEIAASLHYSVKTVEVYLTRLYAKTGVRSRVELALAVSRGDVTLTR